MPVATIGPGSLLAPLLYLDPTNLSDEEKALLVDRAAEILALRYQAGRYIREPADAGDYLRYKLANHKYEVFGCLFLTNRHRILADQVMFTGTIDGASVHPRVIAERSLAHGAAAVICYHNHPSGVAEPSTADTQITVRIRDALALIDVRVLDHLVVGGMDVVSLAERGLL